MLIRKWIVKPPLTTKDRRGAIIALPGRGVPGTIMLRFCKDMELRRTMFAAVEPYKLAWYPQPFGPNDQYAAVAGMENSLEVLQDAIERFMQWQDLKPEETVLLGFSAGSVMALQLAMRSEEKWAACVSLAGAILEPEKVEPAKNETPIILQHNADDDCFKWHERYLPMREALEDNGYAVTRLERPFGRHTLYINDAVNVSKLLAPILGYPKGFAEKYLFPKLTRRA